MPSAIQQVCHFLLDLSAAFDTINHYILFIVFHTGMEYLPIWPQMYGVCYCLSNSYAIVVRLNRRFNYWPQFQDRRSRTPLFHISRRAVRRHYRSRITSQKTARSVVGIEPTTFRTAPTLDSRLVSSLTYVQVTTRRNRSMTSRSLSYICKTTLVGFWTVTQIVYLYSLVTLIGSIQLTCNHCMVLTKL